MRREVLGLALRDAHAPELLEGSVQTVTHQVRVICDVWHDEVKYKAVPMEKVADELPLEAVAPNVGANKARADIHAASVGGGLGVSERRARARARVVPLRRSVLYIRKVRERELSRAFSRLPIE